MKTPRDIVPGRALSLGITLSVLGGAILIPLLCVVLTLRGMTPQQFFGVIFAPRTLASFRLTFGASFVAALLDLVMGSFLAWVLVRRRFSGKAVLEALVDIPFALPTAITGVTLATLYGSNGWAGRLLEHCGIQVAYTPLGIGLALTFVGLPFVVRTVQPVLADLPPELDEASALLGAGPVMRFVRVSLPLLVPAMMTGFALAFARGLGEYGSVIFIAGNMPGRTEIAPLVILTHLEEFDYQAAAAIAVVLLVVSFVMLFVINSLQRSITHARTAL
ncbi:MAG TPA: sulfate ABC transporter permease subunit CysT [Candidatus Acidoferrales bacterium]|nr:sulfate ABC transporter permease subunit CysT [Candidatus Acidoferrales bacterium]